MKLPAHRRCHHRHHRHLHHCSSRRQYRREKKAIEPSWRSIDAHYHPSHRSHHRRWRCRRTPKAGAQKRRTPRFLLLLGHLRLPPNRAWGAAAYSCLCSSPAQRCLGSPPLSPSAAESPRAAAADRLAPRPGDRKMMRKLNKAPIGCRFRLRLHFPRRCHRRRFRWTQKRSRLGGPPPHYSPQRSQTWRPCRQRPPPDSA